jgi:hypothetical protein
MRKTAAVAAALVVASLVLGATVLREPIAKAASPFQNVIIANTSTNPVPVAEQNLDGANIRVHEEGTAAVHEQGTAAVHEQGTASVNVTNSSIPVSGTVNIGNGGMRVIHLGGVTIPKNTAWNFPYQDTSDCRSLAAFINPGDLSLDNSDVFIRFGAANGITDANGSTGGLRAGSSSSVWYFSSSGGVPFFTPKAELVVINHDDDNPKTLGDAWLVCQR